MVGTIQCSVLALFSPHFVTAAPENTSRGPDSLPLPLMHSVSFSSSLCMNMIMTFLLSILFNSVSYFNLLFIFFPFFSVPPYLVDLPSFSPLPTFLFPRCIHILYPTSPQPPCPSLPLSQHISLNPFPSPLPFSLLSLFPLIVLSSSSQVRQEVVAVSTSGSHYFCLESCGRQEISTSPCQNLDMQSSKPRES